MDSFFFLICWIKLVFIFCLCCTGLNAWGGGSCGWMDEASWWIVPSKVFFLAPSFQHVLTIKTRISLKNLKAILVWKRQESSFSSFWSGCGLLLVPALWPPSGFNGFRAPSCTCFVDGPLIDMLGPPPARGRLLLLVVINRQSGSNMPRSFLVKNHHSNRTWKHGKGKPKSEGKVCLALVAYAT